MRFQLKWKLLLILTLLMLSCPLSVSADVTCTACWGSGVCNLCEGSRKCYLCEGAGVVGVSSKTCEICNGSGVCYMCQGTGNCWPCGGTGSKSF